MNNIQYPANIYRTFEIVEGVKRGVKVYGLVEVKRVFRFKFRIRLKICPYGTYTVNSRGDRWVFDKQEVERVIKYANEWSEFCFRKKVLNS